MEEAFLGSGGGWVGGPSKGVLLNRPDPRFESGTAAHNEKLTLNSDVCVSPKGGRGISCEFIESPM